MTTKLNGVQATYIDGIRAAAAFLVLLDHASGIFLHISPTPDGGIGDIGVYLFFLLSGFLISLSVFNKSADPDYDHADYVIDRTSRIFSVYLPALLFVAGLDQLSLRLLSKYPDSYSNHLTFVAKALDENGTLASWVGDFLMLQRTLVAKAASLLHLAAPLRIEPFGSAVQFWTISIEWWLYLTFGYLAFFVFKGRRLGVLNLSLFFFAATTAVYFLVGGSDECLTCLWIVGVLACLLVRHWEPLRKSIDHGQTMVRSRKLLLSASGLFAFASLSRFGYLRMGTRGPGSFHELQFTVFVAATMFSILLLLGTFARCPAWLTASCHFLAKYSFSLYLTHTTVLIFIYYSLPVTLQDWRGMVFGIAAANMVALAFWWLFERHYHRLASWAKAERRRHVLASSVATTSP